jgi:hypothetical protein
LEEKTIYDTQDRGALAIFFWRRVGRPAERHGERDTKHPVEREVERHARRHGERDTKHPVEREVERHARRHGERDTKQPI